MESPESLLLARSQLVIASRVAGLAAPVDTVTTVISDDGPVRDGARRARGLGFSGKFCIHPAQVVPVNSAFRPTSDAVAWAIKVLAVAPSGAAAQVDGHMVDQPVVERARRILDRAGRGHGSGRSDRASGGGDPVTEAATRTEIIAAEPTESLATVLDRNTVDKQGGSGLLTFVTGRHEISQDGTTAVELATSGDFNLAIDTAAY